MQQNNIVISLIWCLSYMFCYMLNIFGFLNSFLTDGSSYYITLLFLFFIIFYHFYFYVNQNKHIHIRTLFKPFFLSVFFFFIMLIVLSHLLPEIFKEAELRGYESRFLANGYSVDEVSENISIINKGYYILLIVGSFLTHFCIFLISIFLFKSFLFAKSKLSNKRISS